MGSFTSYICDSNFQTNTPTYNSVVISFFLLVIYSCVTNAALISPFRGTFNTDITEDGNQVTLYAYLKAFRFTGSPALYLECDIHMCHNKCPVSIDKRF